jgi:phosphoglycolate phosphatase
MWNCDEGRTASGSHVNIARFTSIIFDFDYTLADSSRGVAECINFALAELNLPQVPVEAAHRTIGLHLNEAFVQLAGERHAAHKDAFRRHFARRADQVMNDLTTLFGTVPGTVRRLKGEGKSLAIVSTKFRFRIVEFLQRENLLDDFDVIIGGEDVFCHKPHPEGLYQAAGRLNCRLNETLYVGDSVVDAEAAQRAGIAFAAVLSGMTRREEFDAYPLVAVMENLGQLGVA